MESDLSAFTLRILGDDVAWSESETVNVLSKWSTRLAKLLQKLKQVFKYLSVKMLFLSCFFFEKKKGGVIKAELWEAEYILVLCKAMLIWALGP